MNNRGRFLVALGSVLGYVLAFALLFPVVGYAAAVLSVLPVVTIGWNYGVRVGLFVGLLTVPLNTVLLVLTGDSAADFLSTRILGVLVLTMMGAGTGWIKEIIDQVKRQSDELRRERENLQELVVKRMQVEDALQKAKDSLEIQVAERTAELTQAVGQLQVELGERKRAEEQLVHNALHDPLTDLPNRMLFMDRLDRVLERAKRHNDYMFAVVYLDLDRFKVVNDSLGHNIGDQLLIETAHRLVARLRTLDTVARLGGDEFVILLEDIQGIPDATRIADRIQHKLALPCELDQHQVFVSVSIGIVISKPSYTQAEDLLRDADTAMYRAKALGRGRYEVFDLAMRDRAMTRLELETDLRMALGRQEFFINYQPIVSLGTSRIVGFEALVRWQHPTRGVVAPADFIPMAEETGLIIPIGQWVLGEACRQTHEWQMQFPMSPALTISVNLSAKQFAQPNLVQKIAAVLQETQLDASNLKLELTESMIVEDAEAVSAELSQLRTLGIQTQIDDFGTGYSSLGYLHCLPIDTLKIDRTFVGKMEVNGSGSEIVRTIMSLAHDLGMQVIAEGVETDDQLAKLRAMDCEYAQGYLFAKPVDCAAATALIAQVPW